MIFNRAALTWLVFFVVLVGGCSGPAAPSFPPLHPATGTVVYKGGGPVVGRVKFLPVGQTSYLAEGILGKDGKFSLSTLQPGGEERTPGVPVGEYTVTVIPVTLKPIPTAGRPDIQLSEPVQVKEGENTFKFEISRKP
jgi:hypothetical protein